MPFRIVLPTPALRPFVQHYLLVHVRYDGVDPRQAMKPTTPAPQQCLYFYPRGGVRTFHHKENRFIDLPRSILVGPQVSRLDLHLPVEHLVVGAAFWPGGLHRLLGVPVSEMLDFSVESRALLGPAVAEVAARLEEATSYATMLATLETYLLHMLRRLRSEAEQPLDRLLAVLLPGGHLGFPLDHLAAEACLSPRQFERKFVERVGLNPKLFARIARFDRAFRLKERQPGLDWLAVAVRCGYYDYRHLVRDFREFAGVTPPQLLAAETAHTRVAGGAAAHYLPVLGL
ncbi:AraC family transcriptional regulator [Hymenobacter setariae]|uniref:AraC family transcriptional regulator n=1 Tax=Hymenobacter setariae TaxID=2594794 RepID=A0A558BZ65_9BACT|nr:helix-turn-helix domain-containing protein [Hymenobacter setariae]TVT41817.1 AraC family transcriptional regulator [Hymenobacter setariae]